MFGVPAGARGPSKRLIVRLRPPDQRRLRPVLPATGQDPQAHAARPQRKPRLRHPARQRRRGTGGRFLLHHHGDGLTGAVGRVRRACFSLPLPRFPTPRSTSFANGAACWRTWFSAGQKTLLSASFCFRRMTGRKKPADSCFTKFKLRLVTFFSRF